jgi:hypothetical protein
VYAEPSAGNVVAVLSSQRIGPSAAFLLHEHHADRRLKMSPDTNGNPVTFAADVKPLFRERDRTSMLRHFDLWSFADVSAHASAILARLEDGSMPCDGAWPAERVDVFRQWLAQGTAA